LTNRRTTEFADDGGIVFT